MDCPRVRYPQFNDIVESELAEQGYKVLTDSSEQVRGMCLRAHGMWQSVVGGGGEEGLG